MEEQRHPSVHSEPPKMPNFFEVDKKKVGPYWTVIFEVPFDCINNGSFIIELL